MQGTSRVIKANQVCSITLPIFRNYSHFKVHPSGCFFLYTEIGVVEFTKMFPSREEINYGCKSRKTLKFLKTEKIVNLEFSTDSRFLVICTSIEENKLGKLIIFNVIEKAISSSSRIVCKDANVPRLESCRCLDFQNETWAQKKFSLFFKFFPIHVKGKEYIVCIQRNNPYKRVVYKLDDDKFYNFGKKIGYVLSCIGKAVFHRRNEIWILDHGQICKLSIN